MHNLTAAEMIEQMNLDMPTGWSKMNDDQIHESVSNCVENIHCQTVARHFGLESCIMGGKVFVATNNLAGKTWNVFNEQSHPQLFSEYSRDEPCS